MLRTFCAIALAAAIPAGVAAGQSGGDAQRESAYASAIAHVADSAIRRLDFFPARAQVRAQMLLLTMPRDSAGAIFYEIARRSRDAAIGVDELMSRFEGTSVPDDLHPLHRELLAALRDARGSLDRLASSSTACQVDPAATTRCQSAFTAASSNVAKSYSRYLDVRRRIADQVQDTHTVLPEFVIAARERVREP
jgi:hypothetical protein